MSEFSFLTEQLATQLINERVARTRRSHIPDRRRRRTGRRALASGLHTLAHRLEA